MAAEIINCEQGTPEWHQARCGIPTASEFATILAKGRGGKGESKTRRTYMLKLIGERMTGAPAENYTNHHMDRGHAMEDDARQEYAFMTDNVPELVGFIRNGDVGASPDSLVGNDGLTEIKSKLPHLQLEVLLADVLPPEHKAQVQGQLWVAEREWCDFVSYWPGLPLFIKRVYREESYIQALQVEVRRFLDELASLQAQVEQRYLAA